jgi:hypothetical protein
VQREQIETIDGVIELGVSTACNRRKIT